MPVWYVHLCPSCRAVVALAEDYPANSSSECRNCGDDEMIFVCPIAFSATSAPMIEFGGGRWWSGETEVFLR